VDRSIWRVYSVGFSQVRKEVVGLIGVVKFRTYANFKAIFPGTGD
jgi:hypothetical protein